MSTLRDPHTGKFISLKQRNHQRMLVENVARAHGARLVEWRAGKLVVRVPATTTNNHHHGDMP